MEFGKDNNVYFHEKAFEEIIMRRNFKIMLTRSSNVKIIYFSRSQKSLGQSFQGV